MSDDPPSIDDADPTGFGLTDEMSGHDAAGSSTDMDRLGRIGSHHPGRARARDLSDTYRLVLEREIAETEATPRWVIAYLSDLSDIHARGGADADAEGLMASVLADRRVEPAHLDFHVHRYLKRMRDGLQGIDRSHGRALGSLAPESGKASEVTWTPFLDGSFETSMGYGLRFLSSSAELLATAYRLDDRLARTDAAMALAREAAKGRVQVLLISYGGMPIHLSQVHAWAGGFDFTAAIEDTPDCAWRLRYGNAVDELLTALEEGPLIPRMAVHGDRFVALR